MLIEVARRTLLLITMKVTATPITICFEVELRLDNLFPVFSHEHKEAFAERGAERCYPIAEKY